LKPVITARKNGGNLQIAYTSEDELERILKQLEK